MIFGIGTDVVQVPRIELLLKKYGNLFVLRILNEEEQSKFNAISQKKRPSFLAKKFAAKEALSKALGVGIGKLSFKDIIVLNSLEGKPYVKIDFAKIDMPSYVLHLSLSDDYPIVVAFAVAEKLN